MNNNAKYFGEGFLEEVEVHQAKRETLQTRRAYGVVNVYTLSVSKYQSV